MNQTPKPQNEWNEDELADGRARTATITVLVIEPGKAPETREIPNTLSAMQAIVGGTICSFSSGVPGTIGTCHDKGLILGLPPCRYLPHTRQLIFGTLFFCGYGINSHSLRPQEIAALMDIYEPTLRRWQVMDAIAANDEQMAEIAEYNRRFDK